MVQRLDNMPGRQNLPATLGDNPVAQTMPARVGDSYDVQLLGNTPTPANMPQSNPLAPTGVGDMNVSDTAAGLYVDPTSAFQPAIDFIGGQRTQANERYAQNKADIANIFGNLTQVNRESQDRVRQQFETSIADQAMNTAQRMAQARMGAEGAQQDAMRAMAERGGGPALNMAASPAAVAAERAVGDIGAYGTIWEGQQRAIQAQTQQDIEAGIRGLGQQEIFANQTLQRSLEDTLNQLSGQEVGIRGELAGAIVGARGQVAQANYNEILAEKAAEEARRLAAVRGAYDVEQARIDAEQAIAVAQANAQNRVTNYGNNSAAAQQYLINNGATDQQIANWQGALDSVDLSGVTNSQDAYQRWLQANTSGFKGRDLFGTRSPSAAERAAARLYFDGVRYNRPEEDDAYTMTIPLENTNSPAPRR